MNARAYYNELDPFAAAWLRELIAAGLIAPGDVDERSIVDVRPVDLAGYTQYHFFAGIGGWSYALRLAGWPDDRPVWTGSCPCQPFSAAGKGKAADDERHLWPRWLPLIAECAPSVVFGEQVEAAIGWGWLDVVFSDLETLGYACGAAVLPAASVGAPHIRQRTWFVADSDDPRCGARWTGEAVGWCDAPRLESTGLRAASSLAHADGRDASPEWLQRSREHGQRPEDGGTGLVGDAARDWQRQPRLAEESDGRQGAPRRPSAWSDLIWLLCTDGKARPTQPGIFPLAHGIPNRVGTLRGAGNAIVPEQGAEIISAFLECERERVAT